MDSDEDSDGDYGASGATFTFGGFTLGGGVAKRVDGEFSVFISLKRKMFLFTNIIIINHNFSITSICLNLHILYFMK